MKIQVHAALVEGARSGDIQALELLLQGLQAPVYNLALRMLGQREDAQDATQEILIRVTTHLGSWRGESAFGTWVYQIASNHLLNERSRGATRKEMSFERLDRMLEDGESYALSSGLVADQASPEDMLEARRTALSCTQAMLMCLDAAGRMAYVLDVIFGLESPQAAAVQGISPAAHRQRLARARRTLHDFMGRRCGLVNAQASCHCVKQLPAKRAAAAQGRSAGGLVPTDDDVKRAQQGLHELVAMGDAAAVMRAAPEYAHPQAQAEGIRQLIRQSVMFRP